MSLEIPSAALEGPTVDDPSQYTSGRDSHHDSNRGAADERQRARRESRVRVGQPTVAPGSIRSAVGGQRWDPSASVAVAGRSGAARCQLVHQPIIARGQHVKKVQRPQAKDQERPGSTSTRSRTRRTLLIRMRNGHAFSRTLILAAGFALAASAASAHDPTVPRAAHARSRQGARKPGGNRPQAQRSHLERMGAVHGIRSQLQRWRRQHGQSQGRRRHELPARTSHPLVR